MQDKPSAIKRWFRRVLVGLLGSVALLLATEGILRILIPMDRSAQMSQDVVQNHVGTTFRYDPDLYWYWQNLPDSGPGVNVYGFRRKKIMYQHGSPGITRVIVLGDSQTFGGGVKAEESFPYFAEEKLGKDWEVLNAGISGYRSLNIYRLLRLKMLAYDPDIIVVDVMPKDSPREDGPLVGKAIGEKGLGEWLWSSRVYYVSQLLLRITGLRPWETLPWPLQLHEIRNRFSSPEALAYSELGNEDLIARWADENGIKVIFMNYAYRNGQILFCHDSPGSKPEGYALLDTCALLKESGYRAEELFQDANHLTILGNKVVGEALAGFLGQVR